MNDRTVTFEVKAMKSIPTCWEFKKLIDVAILQRGNDLPLNQRLPGSYPVIGSNGVVGYHSEFISRGPGVLVGRSGSVGKVTLVETDFWPLNTTLWVKNFQGNDPNFIYYLLSCFDFSKYISGVSVPTLNRNLVHPMKVCVPPLSEQRAISHVLWTVQQARDARLHEIALERERKAALMEHLFRHGTKGEPTKQTEIGEIPESWQIVLLGEFAKVRGGFAFKSADYSTEGMPLLKISNVSFGKIIWDDISFLPEEYKHTYKQFLLNTNDLVMAITRPIVSQGIKVSILSEKDTPCLLNQRVCQFIPGKNINLCYIFYVIHTKHFIESITNGASGSQQPNISTTKVESISIGLPTLNEQNDIAAILTACDSRIAALEQEAHLLDELFRAMLEELMTGRLSTVNLIETEATG